MADATPVERRSSRMRKPSVKLREEAVEEPPKKKRVPKSTPNADTENIEKTKKKISTKATHVSKQNNTSVEMPPPRNRKSNLSHTPDQLDGEGQALLSLYELEEESRTLKLLHDKISDQIRALQDEETTILNRLIDFESQMSRQQRTIGHNVPTISASSQQLTARAITSTHNDFVNQYQHHSSLRALVTGNTSKFDMYDHTNKHVLEENTTHEGTFGVPAENITIQRLTNLNNEGRDEQGDGDDDFMYENDEDDDDDDDDDASQQMRRILRQSNVEEYNEDEDDIDEDDEMD
jgi:hypothetical protein